MWSLINEFSKITGSIYKVSIVSITQLPIIWNKNHKSNLFAIFRNKTKEMKDLYNENSKMFIYIYIFIYCRRMKLNYYLSPVT
jgi:hypothetical protein